MTIEDLKALLSVLPDVMHTWTASLALFLFSTAVIIVEYLPLEDVKLSPMNTKTILLIIWFFSLMVLIVKGICEVSRQYRQRRRDRETKQRALNYVRTLSPAEQALLKYIYHSPVGAVYLPYDDAAALNLWKGGALRRVVNVLFQRKDTGCFLYDMLPQLRTLIAENYGVLNWGAVPSNEAMIDYQ